MDLGINEELEKQGKQDTRADGEVDEARGSSGGGREQWEISEEELGRRMLSSSISMSRLAKLAGQQNELTELEPGTGGDNPPMSNGARWMSTPHDGTE